MPYVGLKMRMFEVKEKVDQMYNDAAAQDDGKRGSKAAGRRLRVACNKLKPMLKALKEESMRLEKGLVKR